MGISKDVGEVRDQQTTSTQEIIDLPDSDSDASLHDPDFLDGEGYTKLYEVKTLYEGEEARCSCCINWVEEPPEDVETSVEEEEESGRHAILVRLRRNHGSGKKMVLHSVVVQNPDLKSLLGEVFKEYSGITPTLKKLVFKAPFHCFFYEWQRLDEMIGEINKPFCNVSGRLLQKILESELRATISLSKDLNGSGVVTYDHLWTIFKPGIDIYTCEDGYDHIYRLSRTISDESGFNRFQLVVSEVDYNGNAFGFRTKHISLDSFLGTKKVQDLDAFPASYHPRLDEVKKTLKRRGEMFRHIHLKPYYYGAYKGPVIDGKHRRNNVEGRIVVDPSSYASFANNYIHLEPFDSGSLKPGVDVSDQMHTATQAFPTPGSMGQGGPAAGYPPHLPPRPRPRPQPQPRRMVHRHITAQNVGSAKWPDLTDDLLHLCSAKVLGYCLRIKKWAVFYIDHIREIQWQDRAFDDLVLDGSYKRLITAFIESHVENKERFDDMIEGKGQGITILFEGPPGVGKTLTAEAVSEKFRRPLYAMGAAELGANPELIEENLLMILEAAAKWDAVLLLDECDVLLAKRSADSLDRNSIVAVFLRLLEYYRGMLFMTTNRVQAIDPAFQSRIHLTIKYPSLDAAARRKIWERFLLPSSSSQESALRHEDFAELQSFRLNGREIKNLVKMAQLLASHEKVPLAMDHVRTALHVTKANSEELLLNTGED
ncbi:P-loop containing nucleoside triphosphate hydrolase protein [Durotheca rogersii]|uniref:P-loop containing nucleoside triphosphate hydrolase protein n=1 Tax=Durotheca rogersii TaxID=419775 RepID=UPI00221FA33B|nr:P-loop containing nucleoside triphosphate hydrolase protein [Durotheca rogersii]KAI5863276.1 P-loop containing nucleoside triphosphate hydrolase protein [Durotheca rogersii]